MLGKHRTIVGALALPINKKGEYLLALRNDPIRSELHNKWEVVGGGWELGETLEECMLREAQEEIGVTPRILFPYPIIHSSTRQRDGHDVQLLLACFLVTLDGQTPTPNHREILELTWCKPAEVAKIDSLPLTQEFISKAQEIHMHILPHMSYNTNTGEGTVSDTSTISAGH